MKKNLSIDKILAETQDAILASGKKFHDIPQEAIEGFLANSGIPMDQIKKIYKILKDENTVKNTKVESTIYTPSDLHYSEKVRQPRKSVFSEIKKIA